MGSLTVYFAGICTHLREFTSRETEHRVVLVNAREGRTINKKTIAPHQAFLIYADAEGKPVRVDLNGVHITVNAASPEVTYDRSFFTCLPRLTAYAPKLAPLAMDAAKGKNAELVAAYFDASGRFLARADESGASMAILNMVTQGAPRLTLTNFDGTSRPPIELQNDAVIQIENVGPGKDAEGGDRTHDFLLHYLVTQGIPSDASYPSARGECAVAALPFASNTVDPGCSNSNYP